MISSDPVFEEILDKSIKIWRYMDFTKFISLLSTSSLYFARADSFGDPFEGSWTNLDLVEREDRINKAVADGVGSEEAAYQFRRLMEFQPRNVAISCWHENEDESATMWKLYLQSNKGIAIQTTLESFKKSFGDIKEDLFLGRVHYINYANEKFKGDLETDSICRPFAHKRKGFKHEKEIRAIYMQPMADYRIMDKGILGGGKSIKINVPMLIQNIYISPSAPGWFKELVEGSIKKYGYEMQPIQSDLDNDPLF